MSGLGQASVRYTWQRTELVLSKSSFPLRLPGSQCRYDMWPLSQPWFLIVQTRGCGKVHQSSLSAQWCRYSSLGNQHQPVVCGCFMPISFTNTEWGGDLAVVLFSEAVNLSQILRYWHNEVSIILLSESSKDSLTQPVSYSPTTFYTILLFNRLYETSICCIVVLMTMQKLNHTNSAFRI